MPGRKKKSALPTIPATETCNGIKRGGKSHCTARAGWGTDHVGQGRCKLHGGCPAMKHGRYSTMKTASIREKIEELRKDEDPLDLTDDLLAMRATWIEYIEKLGDDAKSLAARVEGSKILEAVSRIVERIEKIRSENAIGAADYLRLQAQQGQAVERAIERHLGSTSSGVGAAILNEIKDAWLALRAAPASTAGRRKA